MLIMHWKTPNPFEGKLARVKKGAFVKLDNQRINGGSVNILISTKKPKSAICFTLRDSEE